MTPDTEHRKESDNFNVEHLTPMGSNPQSDAQANHHASSVHSRYLGGDIVCWPWFSEQHLFSILHIVGQVWSWIKERVKQTQQNESSLNIWITLLYKKKIPLISPTLYFWLTLDFLSVAVNFFFPIFSYRFHLCASKNIFET